MAWSRWLKGLASTSFLGLVIAPLAASSCAEAEARFYIECAATSDSCGCDEETGQLAAGAFNRAACDVNSDGITAGVCGYQVNFVLKNNMFSSLDSQANNNQVETSRITIYAYDLTIESDGGSFVSVQEGAMLASVTPEGGIVCVPLPLFVGDPTGGAGGQVNAIAAVRFYGRTTGGLEVETPEQFFPFVVYDAPGECCCEEDCPTESPLGWDGAPVACDPTIPQCMQT